MILPAQKIMLRNPIKDMVTKTIVNGMSYGLSHCGYDVRIDQDIVLRPGGFALASTVEEFDIPNDLCAMVMDKSSWARRGLGLFNTILEPGWGGCLTLELANMNPWWHYLTRHFNPQHEATLRIAAGSPIAQVVFIQLTEATQLPYEGKYQNQKRGPQPWIRQAAG